MLAAEKIGRLAAEWMEQGAERMRPEVRMGCAIASAKEHTSTDLLQRAESAMRRSREADKRILMFDEHEAVLSATATHPLFDARKAIENGEFRVHYQPQFNIQTGNLVGAEALVRWAGPDGLLSPANFMNELERARALMPLLQFIVNNSSREMSRWLRRMPDLTISVNSSANDLEDAGLVEIMGEVLSMWNVDPQRLTLEITETSLMRNPDVGIATLHALRELGMRTSIDDFGTGYSSLVWLKDLPVDELKIDRAFVQRIVNDRKDRRIVEGIIDLGHAMGMNVVAEGIETEGVLHVLREAKCDVGQGFFYSQPLSSAEFERTWLVDAPRQPVGVG
jgi:EAL domain-containing protein (putative c-di-GMP-specific phosphodiesterase class I)